MEFRELRAFVAVAEEGSFSAAARRVHVSQPALSQTVNALERELGVQLVVRSNVGIRLTDSGAQLLARARAMLADHDATVAALADRGGAPAAIRLGVPLEMPADLLADALARLAAEFPDAAVQVRHHSSAGALEALTAGDLDVGLVRQRPAGQQLDSVLVLREPLGVLLSSDRAQALASAGGVGLDRLTGLAWLAFAREDSPAWYDEVVAVLRSHGHELGAAPDADRLLIPEVKLAAVAGGGAFSLAPPAWSQPLPAGVQWCPLAGDPLVRRTWAAWPATSRRRDLGALVAALEDAAHAHDRP